MKRFARPPLVALAFMATAFVLGCGSGGGGAQPPILSVAQSNVLFNGAFGGSNPAPISINVTNTGGGTLTFNATSDSQWLSVTPGNGTAPQTLQVSAALGTLTTAGYMGHIQITANGAQGSPATITATFDVAAPPPSNSPTWAQWGANPQHTGMVNVAGQKTAHQLADIMYDKFAPEEEAEEAAIVGAPVLLVHYQAPLIDGNDVYMMTKSGSYTSCGPVGAWQTGASCGPNTWNTMIWNESRFTWENGKLIHI
jgi:BACON domain-containing protein